MKLVHPYYPEGDACRNCGHQVRIVKIPPNAEEAICDHCGWTYYREGE